MMIKVIQKGKDVKRFYFGVYEYENNYKNGNTDFDHKDDLEMTTFGVAELVTFGHKNPYEVFDKWRLKEQRAMTKKEGVPQIIKDMDYEEFRNHMAYEVFDDWE